MQWQYRVLDAAADGLASSWEDTPQGLFIADVTDPAGRHVVLPVENALRFAGDTGWELVTVIPTGVDDYRGATYRYFFKRPGSEP